MQKEESEKYTTALPKIVKKKQRNLDSDNIRLKNQTNQNKTKKGFQKLNHKLKIIN